MCGDFIINLLDYKLNNHTQHFVDLLFTLSLFPLINRPTRLSNQHALIIDNIFTNAINMNINCGIIMEDINDHFPIFCISQLDVKKPLKSNNELFIEKTLMIILRSLIILLHYKIGKQFTMHIM